MRLAQPPASASWLLEHLVLGEKNDALTGDLLEDFQQRRSVRWYWRQVLGAILTGFVSELRAEWSSAGYEIVWTFGFAAVWTCTVSTIGGYLNQLYLASMFSGPSTMPKTPTAEQLTYFRAMLFAGSPIIFLSVGLLLYSVGIRSFNLRRCIGGLGVLLVDVEDMSWRFVLGLKGLVLWHFIAFWWTWFSWLPMFAAVLISIGIAGPDWLQRNSRISSGRANNTAWYDCHQKS